MSATGQGGVSVMATRRSVQSAATRLRCQTKSRAQSAMALLWCQRTLTKEKTSSVQTVGTSLCCQALATLKPSVV